MGIKLILMFFCGPALVQCLVFPSSFYIRLGDYTNRYVEFVYTACPNGQDNYARVLATAEELTMYSVQFQYIDSTEQFQSMGGAYLGYSYCFDFDQSTSLVNLFPCKGSNDPEYIKNQQWSYIDEGSNRFSICLYYLEGCITYNDHDNRFKICKPKREECDNFAHFYYTT